MKSIFSGACFSALFAGSSAQVVEQINALKNNQTLYTSYDSLNLVDPSVASEALQNQYAQIKDWSVLHSGQSQLFGQSVNPGQINQGSINDGFLIAAVAGLARN